MAGYDSYVKLLCHFDGEDGATTTTDETGKTVTLAGNAQLDTAQQKFGSASLLLDGSGDWARIADTDDVYFNGDFTVDCWLRLASKTGSMCVWWHSTGNDGVNNHRLQIDAVSTNNTFEYQVYASSSKVVSCLSTAAALAINEWFHIAVERYGNIYNIYKNGTSIARTDDAQGPANYSDVFYMGAGGGVVYFLNGWMDEFRVSKGIARYQDANFTPPTEAYSALTPGYMTTNSKFWGA